MEDRYGFESKPLAFPLDTRGNDRSEGRTINRFPRLGDALRSAAMALSFGRVYDNVPVPNGGVRANNDGMRRTMNTQTGFYGVVRAYMMPSGIQYHSLTKLSQAGGNAIGWSGDAPVDTQTALSRPAPWLTRASRGNAAATFRSGVSPSPHSAVWGGTGNPYQAAAARRGY